MHVKLFYTCEVFSQYLENFSTFQYMSELFNTLACNFIQKETLAHVFSCEFCEIFKNTFFTEQLRATASGTILLLT